MTPTELPAPGERQRDTSQVSTTSLRLYSPHAPLSVKQWADGKARIRWENRGSPSNPPDDWADWFAVVHELENEFASVQGENTGWLEEHSARLAAEHPQWKGQWVAVCCRTDQKLLAVADKRNLAFEQGLDSRALLELAQHEDSPPEILLTVAYLDDSDTAEV